MNVKGTSNEVTVHRTKSCKEHTSSYLKLIEKIDKTLKDETSDDNHCKFIYHSERHIQLKYQTIHDNYLRQIQLDKSIIIKLK